MVNKILHPRGRSASSQRSINHSRSIRQVVYVYAKGRAEGGQRGALGGCVSLMTSENAPRHTDVYGT